MKIDYAIHSVDDNPLYADFWTSVSKVWKQKFNIQPILLVLKKKEEFCQKDYDETYGTVINVNPIQDYPVYLQCLWIRYWFPTTARDKVSIISDIDMFPISKSYFIDQIRNIKDDKYVHLYANHSPYFPTCYHVAKGHMFQSVLDMPEDFKAALDILVNSGERSEEHMGNALWGIDESFASKKILEYSDKNSLALLTRSGNRIDRADWHYDPSLLRHEHYLDCHSIRPYSAHKEEIDKLVEIILEASA